MGFRAPPHLAEKIREYADERGISQSEALRRFVESGYQATTGDPPTVDEQHGEEFESEFEQNATVSASEVNMDARVLLWTVMLFISSALGAFVGSGVV